MGTWILVYAIYIANGSGSSISIDSGQLELGSKESCEAAKEQLRRELRSGNFSLLSCVKKS